MALYAAGNPDTALDVIEPVLDDHPKHRLLYAKCLEQLGRFEESASEAALAVSGDRISLLDNDSVIEGLVCLGTSRYLLDEDELALLAFADAASLVKKNTPVGIQCSVVLGQAEIDIYFGRYAEAEESLESSKQKFANATLPALSLYRLEFLHGRSLYHQQKFDAAATAYTSALAFATELDSGMEVQSIVRLADALESAGNPAKAVGIVKRALDKAIAGRFSLSQRFDISIPLFMILVDRRDERTAEEYLRRIVEDPKLKQLDSERRLLSHLYLGESISAQYRPAEALPFLQTACSIADAELPNHRFDCQFAIGDAWSALGNLNEATKHFEIAIGLASANSESGEPLCKASLALGEAFAGQGRMMEAVEMYESAIRISEESEVSNETRLNAMCLFADLLREQGRYQQSLDLLEKSEVLAGSVVFDDVAKFSIKVSRARCLREFGDVVASDNLLVEISVFVAGNGQFSPLPHIDFCLLAAESATLATSKTEKERYLFQAKELVEGSLQNPLMTLNVFTSLLDFLTKTQQFPKSENVAQKMINLIESHEFSPLAKCNSLLVLADYQRAIGEQDLAIASYESARNALLAVFSQNRWSGGIANIISAYRPILHKAHAICEAKWQENIQSDNWLWKLLEFIDAQQCISIREGLRRHVRGTRHEPRPSWIPRRLGRLESVAFDENTGLVRDGTHSARTGNVTELSQRVDSNGVDGRQYCVPANRHELEYLISKISSTIIQFKFVGDDLVALPIFRSPEGTLTIGVDHDRLFSRQNVRGKLERLVQLQRDVNTVFFSSRSELVNMHANEIRQRLGDLQTAIYEPLFQLIGFDDLIGLLERYGLNPAQTDVCIIPDGLLFDLPLHAACSSRAGTRLYERFKTIRYGLSLRTLLLQQEMEEAEERFEEIRGVLFASSHCESTNHGRLQGVNRESQYLDSAFPGRWMVFDDEKERISNCENFAKFHGAGNVLWFSGHGGLVRQRVDDDQSRSGDAGQPAILLKDRPLLDTEMVSAGMSFSKQWLVHLSCCMLGAIGTESRHSEVEGFLASTTLLGCRRVTSAMWPVTDIAASAFGGLFASALAKRISDSSPNCSSVVASALKDALQEFRQIESGRFDHECFWAAYTLFGLG